jgi:hypothetical protein
MNIRACHITRVVFTQKQNRPKEWFGNGEECPNFSRIATLSRIFFKYKNRIKPH